MRETGRPCEIDRRERDRREGEARILDRARLSTNRLCRTRSATRGLSDSKQATGESEGERDRQRVGRKREGECPERPAIARATGGGRVDERERDNGWA